MGRLSTTECTYLPTYLAVRSRGPCQDAGRGWLRRRDHQADSCIFRLQIGIIMSVSSSNQNPTAEILAMSASDGRASRDPSTQTPRVPPFHGEGPNAFAFSPKNSLVWGGKA